MPTKKSSSLTICEERRCRKAILPAPSGDSVAKEE